MDEGDHGTSTSVPMLPGGRSIGIGILQLLLVPVLFVVAFGFLFVGMGFSPDGDVVTARDVLTLGLYIVVGVTILVLLVGPPLMWIARSTNRPTLERRAAYVPLWLAAVSAVILVGLGVAGSALGQTAGP